MKKLKVGRIAVKKSRSYDSQSVVVFFFAQGPKHDTPLQRRVVSLVKISVSFASLIAGKTGNCLQCGFLPM